MTLFTFIKQCLRKEAARTEPDCTKIIKEVLTSQGKKRSEQDPPPARGP